MKNEAINESPLENVIVFIVSFALILGFCGGVIGMWMLEIAPPAHRGLGTLSQPAAPPASVSYASSQVATFSRLYLA